MKRREFLKKQVVGASALMLGAKSPAFFSARPEERDPINNLPHEPGNYYEATVPDTLDLAEHARLAVNHITSIICPEADYEAYWQGCFGGGEGMWPGHMLFQFSSLLCIQGLSVEALAGLRLMSGSKQHLEREGRTLATMVSCLGKDDGIWWVPPTYDGEHKPWLGPEKWRPYSATVHGQGNMLRLMVAWYQYTGDSAWKERIDRMVNGLDRIMAVHKDDYAYFPTHGWMPEMYLRSCYVKSRGWKDTSEPPNEKFGEEGSLMNHQGIVPDPIANWYMLTGSPQALRFSGELVRFLTKPKFWADWPGGEYPGVVGAENAHWRGHWQGYMDTLKSIMNYTTATNDPRLQLFVREAYEWGRQAELARIGVVGDGQGCGCGRLIYVAIKLTDAGVGDYWEDVDLYIRNHGIEMQVVPEDVPHLEKFLAKYPNPPAPADFIAEAIARHEYPNGIPAGVKVARSVGTSVGFMNASMGGIAGGPAKAEWHECCEWGNLGIFYTWQATLRYADGVARVNLLLNRASPWMDIDSYLPYEGKVVLRNKTAREAFVRIPLWVDKKTVQCRIGDQTVRLEWFGNYLRLRDLKPGNVATIEFPMAERTEQWSAWPSGPFLLTVPQGTVYTIKFRGNTVVELSPELGPGWWLYQGRPEKYQATKAPMKKVTRYVTPATLIS